MFFVLSMVFGIVVVPTLLYVEIMLNIEGKGKVIWRVRKILFRNRLYECRWCKRLYRNYQSNERVLYSTIVHDCPHCTIAEATYTNPRVKEAKWMNVHPDCPKTNLYEHFKMMRMFKKIEKNKQDMKDQEYFEEYNKLHVDMKWIENLTKK